MLRISSPSVSYLLGSGGRGTVATSCAETMQALLRRVQLREADPELMPPRRSGHLPAWAIERIKAYFEGR